MERVKEKIEILSNVLTTLDEAIQLFNEYTDSVVAQHILRNEQILLAMRDSMIQRFEYCTDLFWKTLRMYLEWSEKIDVAINSPRGIVREAVKAKVISEHEGAECMSMIECRNKTSHMYHAQLAHDIAQHIPQYYELIKKLTQRIKVAA